MMLNGTTFTTKGEAVFNAIWGNSDLRENLLPQTIGINTTDLNNLKPTLKTLFSNNISDVNNNFYDFIKVK